MSEVSPNATEPAVPTPLPPWRKGLNLVEKITSSPLFGVAGFVVGILGLWTTYYFYKLSERHPDLTYSVSPIKAVVVGVKDAKGLNLTLDGKPLKDGLTAAQIMIWNAGAEPIDMQSMLELFVIRVRGTKILQASVVNQSRKVVGMKVIDKKSLLDKGALVVAWDILEQDDAGVVQIIYEGDGDTEITVDATIKGQKKLHTIYPEQLASPFLQPEDGATLTHASTLQRVILTLIALFGAIVLTFYIFSPKRADDRPIQRFFNWLLYAMTLCYLLGTCYAIFEHGIRLPIDFCGSCGAASSSGHVDTGMAPAQSNEGAPTQSDKAPERSEDKK